MRLRTDSHRERRRRDGGISDRPQGLDVLGGNSYCHGQNYTSGARPKAALTAVAALAGLLVAACGTSSGPSPTPSPLGQAQLQRLYKNAANAYNTAEVPLAQAEYGYCVAKSPPGDLPRCEAALGQDRQATIAYDNSLRGLVFPAAAKADVATLLSDDTQLETLLQQASTAPSLAAVTALTPQIFALIATTNGDAIKLRADLGLPAATLLPTMTPGPAA